jgi:hypothetical protein
MEREANPELREFAKKWFVTVQELLEKGLLKPHPIQKMDGGLDEVMTGLDMLKNKQVSGKKLVYTLL